MKRIYHLLFLCVLGVIMAMQAKAEAVYTYDPNSKLIISANQLSANASQVGEGDDCIGVSALIDGIKNWYHTAYSGDGLVDADHYLQVHLDNALQRFFYSFVGRDGVSHDTWDDVDVYATNTPDDESSWQKRVELRDIINGDPNAPEYTSNVVDLGESFSDIRFVVINTTSGRTEGTYNRHFWNLDEFQMFEAYEVKDEKTMLSLLVDSINALKINLNIGTEPGYYTQAAADAYMQAYSNAQTAVDNGSSSDEEYKTIGNALRKALADLRASIIPVTEGYYYILNSYAEYFNQQGVEKSIYANAYGKLCWENHDPESAFHLFKFTALSDSSFSIQNMATKQFIGEADGFDALVPMTNEQNVAYLFKHLDNSYSYNIRTVDNEYPFHTRGHSSGAGISGDICTYPGGVGSASAWKLIRVTDEELIKRLSEEGAVKAATELVSDAIASAKENIKKTYDYAGLITNADDDDPENCQFSSNAKETKEGSFKGLIDDDPNTFFHSFWSEAGPDEPHNLQADLKEKQEGIFFKFTPRQGTAYFDTPSDFYIYGTNDDELGKDPTSANTDWTEVDHITSGYPTNASTSYISESYTFPYRYFRIVVEETVSGRANTTSGYKYFNFSAFQIYSTTPLESSEYYTVKGMKEAVDNLEALVKAAEGKIADKTVVSSDTTAILEAIRTVNSLYMDRSIIYNKMKELVAEGEKAYEKATRSSIELITDADQFSSNNSSVANYSSFEHLIDGNTHYNNNFHSIWNTAMQNAEITAEEWIATMNSEANAIHTGTGYHNLQVKLNRPISSFKFEYIGRTGTLIVDNPTDIEVYVTNDDELGASTDQADIDKWTLLTELTEGFPGKEAGARYMSPNLKLESGETFKYVRFVIKHTAMEGTETYRQFANPDVTGITWNVGEWQMYQELDKPQSEYIEGMKEACEALKALMDKAATIDLYHSTDSAINVSLKEAILKLQSLYADTKELTNLIKKYKGYVESSVVSEENYGIGYVDTQEAIDEFDKSIDEAGNMVDYSMPTTTAVNAAIAKLNEAYKTFMTHVGQIEPYKWYNIISGATRAFAVNQPVFLGSTSTGAVLKIGGYPIDEVLPETDPYAIWRFVPIEGQEGQYAIQSLGTGQYFGAYRGKGADLAPLMSHEKTPYQLYYYGNGKFKLQQVGVEDDFNCLKVDGTNLLVLNYPANGDHQQSWIFKPIEEGQELSINYYFDNNIQIMTLPFEINDDCPIAAINENVKTYAVKNITTGEETRLELTEKNNFKAGEPFIIVTGDYKAYDGETKHPIRLVLPTEVTDTSAIVANGLTGTLEGMTINKVGMGIFTDAKLMATGAQTTIEGRFGYIDPKLVVDNAEATADLIITTNEKVGIKATTVVNTKDIVNVYTIDGKLLKRNVKAGEALKNLKKGIYIIGKKKIAVK